MPRGDRGRGKRVRSVRPGGGPRTGAGPRLCGPCTACCSSLAINELGKPEWTACERLTGVDEVAADDRRPYAPVSGGGCGAYDERPGACRGFRCLWLTGFPLTDERHRPDRCGVIVMDTADPKAVQVRELWPGATKTGAGRELVTALRRAQLEIVITTPTSQHTLMPLTLFGTPVVNVTVGQRRKASARQGR